MYRRSRNIVGEIHICVFVEDRHRDTIIHQIRLLGPFSYGVPRSYLSAHDDHEFSTRWLGTKLKRGDESRAEENHG